MQEPKVALVIGNLVSPDLVNDIVVKNYFCSRFFSFADFKDLSARISKRSLDGARVSLEQMDQTDCVYVENLHPGVTDDFLYSYFESQDLKVMNVTMLSESAAKVSFDSYDCKCPKMSWVTRVF